MKPRDMIHKGLRIDARKEMPAMHDGQLRVGDGAQQQFRHVKRNDGVVERGEHKRGRGNAIEIGGAVEAQNHPDAFGDDGRGREILIRMRDRGCHVGEIVFDPGGRAGEEQARRGVGLRPGFVEDRKPRFEQQRELRIGFRPASAQHDGLHAAAVIERQHLRDGAAGRMPDNMRRGNLEMIQHVNRVARQYFNRVGLLRPLALPGAAMIHQDDLVSGLEQRNDRGPEAGHAAEPRNEEERFAFAGYAGEQPASIPRRDQSHFILFKECARRRVAEA